MRQPSGAKYRAACACLLSLLAAMMGCGGTGGKLVVPAVRITIGSGGGTVVDGNATLTVPGNALTQATQFSVQSATQYPADARLVVGTAYAFSSTATTFASSVRVSLRYNAAALKASQAETGVRLYQVVSGVWTQVSGSSVDINNKTVTGTTTTLGTFAVFAAVAG